MENMDNTIHPPGGDHQGVENEGGLLIRIPAIFGLYSPIQDGEDEMSPIAHPPGGEEESPEDNLWAEVASQLEEDYPITRELNDERDLWDISSPFEFDEY